MQKRIFTVPVRPNLNFAFVEVDQSTG